MQLFINLVWCRHRARNFASHNFSVTQAQPMNVGLYCRCGEACPPGRLVIGREIAAAGKKALELFEEFDLAFGLQFFAQ